MQKVSRRKLLHLLGASAAAGLIAACQTKVVKEPLRETVEIQKEVTQVVEKLVTATPAPEPQGKIIIGLVHLEEATYELAKQRVTAAYRDLNPKVEIEWLGPPQGGDYTTWLTTMLTAQPPEIDIASVSWASYQGYVDLEKYRKATNPYTGHSWDEDLDFDFYTDVTMTGARSMVGTRGVKLCWLYNKDLFAQAGVQPPKTWTELLEVCAKLKSAGITPIASNWYNEPYRFGIPYFEQLHRKEIYEVAGAREGDWNHDPDKDGTYQYKSTDVNGMNKFYTFSLQRFYRAVRDGEWRFDNPELTFWMNSWMAEGKDYTLPDLYAKPDIYVHFLQQKAAMIYDATWSFGTLQKDLRVIDDQRREQLKLGQDIKIKPFSWGSFGVPSLEGPLTDGPVGSIESVTGEYVSVVQREQAQTDLAMDFLMFWLSPKGYQPWLDGLYLKGYTSQGPVLVRGVTEPMDDPELYKDVVAQGNTENFPNAAWFHMGPSGGALEQELYQVAKDTFDGKLTPEECGKKLQAIHTDPKNFQMDLEAMALKNEDLDHPERQPGT